MRARGSHTLRRLERHPTTRGPIPSWSGRAGRRGNKAMLYDVRRHRRPWRAVVVAVALVASGLQRLLAAIRDTHFIEQMRETERHELGIPPAVEPLGFW